MQTTAVVEGTPAGDAALAEIEDPEHRALFARIMANQAALDAERAAAKAATPAEVAPPPPPAPTPPPAKPPAPRAAPSRAKPKPPPMDSLADVTKRAMAMVAPPAKPATTPQPPSPRRPQPPQPPQPPPGRDGVRYGYRDTIAARIPEGRACNLGDVEVMFAKVLGKQHTASASHINAVFAHYSTQGVTDKQIEHAVHCYAKHRANVPSPLAYVNSILGRQHGARGLEVGQVAKVAVMRDGTTRVAQCDTAA